MGTLTVQRTPITGGGDLSMASAAGGGDEFTNDGKTFVLVSNGGGAQITVTFATPQTVSGLAVADGAGTVEAGGLAVFGPFPTQTFNNDGKVQITYSGVTSVTISAFN